jgi:uncharacterized repeat protein (TIGR01451 family)/LPXTG-motif cell wall-anchored protein
VLSNGATSATINLRTDNDTYFPGVVSFSTELFAPQIALQKSAVDANGGTLDTGDEVLYTIRVANGGQDGAAGVVLADEIPEFTTFVAGSLRIDGAPATDGAGDDLGELEASPERVVARIGGGATAASGGSLAIGASSTVSFRVVVGEVPTGEVVSNVAGASFRAATSGLPIEAVSNTSVLAPRPRSDLSVLKTGPTTPVTIPGTVDYTITVENRGPADEPAAVIVDDLPAGLSVVGTTASQGTCSNGTGVVTCDLGPLAVGATATVVVSGSLVSGGGAITNSVTASGSNLDLLPNNDTARAETKLNNPPVAIDQTATTPNGTAVTVAATSGATDPDGDLITLVAAGPATDGSVVVNADGTVTFTPNPGFVGNTSIPFTISDGRGGSSTATITVTVLNAPPIAVDDAVSTPPATAVVIGVLDNDSDPNADALTVTGVTQPAAGPIEGVATLNADGTIVFVPNASFQGTSTFTYTITDGIDTSTATVMVVVPDAAPVAIDDWATTPSATVVVIDVLANDLDDNGDTLTVVAVGQPPGGASVGVASIDVDGSVRFEPAPGFRGLAVFDYTVSDGLETVTATVTVDVLNAPPVATADGSTTASGTPVTIDLLVNDSDPNDDPLSVVDIVPPAGGSVTVAADRTVTYTPNPGFKGVDVITYTISDGIDTATAPVTVTVLNAPPVAAQDLRTTGSGRPVAIDVLGNDSDPNDDTLTVTPVVVNGPSNGTAVVDPDGTITYTPAPGFAGADSFEYTISDGTDTATARVVVTVLNGPPVAGDDTATTPSGVAVAIDVLGNDSDPNDDTLTVTPVVVNGPSNGTAVVDPDGTITYTPAPGFAGADSFEYTISDGTDTATARVTVTVTAAVTPPTTSPSSGTATSTTLPVSGATTSTVEPVASTTPRATSSTVPVTTLPIAGATSTTVEPVASTTPRATSSTVPVTGRLPSTGASPTASLASGALAIAAGVVLVVVTRRRTRAGGA